MSRLPLIAALLASGLLFAVRIYAAHVIGFGDAEALYACYARHPQPVYLDHPGLIGLVARLIGGGDTPSPRAAHLVTACLATGAPWMAALAARAAGAPTRAAAVAALALVLAPEINVGLFGLTPDLLLVWLWYASIAASAWALLAEPSSVRALLGALASGAAAGLACEAKVTGALLFAGLVLGWSSPHARAHRRTLGPWAGVAVVVVLVSPVVLDEVVRGFPMLRHRLITTQREAGPSLRNVGALLGGQLLYVTPPLLVGAVLVARDLYRRRRDDGVSWLLWSTTVACVPLVVLGLVSRVAEPHWIAPIYLALPVHLARRWPEHGLFGPRLANVAVATGASLAVALHAWILLPLGPWLLGSRYVARYDLANDLYAWAVGAPLLRKALIESADSELGPPVVVGPHWTVCAQAHAALPASVLVGCRSAIPDDFARWLPPSTWKRAPVLLYVTDDRFDNDTPEWRDRRVDASWQAGVDRGGRVVRRITVTRLKASAVARSGGAP